MTFLDKIERDLDDQEFTDTKLLTGEREAHSASAVSEIWDEVVVALQFDVEASSNAYHRG